jgi:hypothetical protein
MTPARTVLCLAISSAVFALVAPTIQRIKAMPAGVWTTLRTMNEKIKFHGDLRKE